jgi:hypothetical protein
VPAPGWPERFQQRVHGPIVTSRSRNWQAGQALTARRRWARWRQVGRAWDLSERGEHWHADIEVLRVLHPGMWTLRDWLDRSGAEKIRKQQAAG